VEAASRHYFNRSAADLGADQAAALAGSLPFPRRSNPGFRPGRMRWRQDLILRRMQGEPVEVPPPVAEDLAAPEEGAAVVADSTGMDTATAASDSAGTAPPADTVTPGRADSLGVPTPPDTTN
jgi:hypothetical protein